MRTWTQLDERYLFAYSALFGIACGIASNHGILAGSWANLIFWAIVGVVLGVFAERSRAALISGALYGFFLVTSFLYAGYQGASDTIPSFIGLSLVLAIVGVGCGIICTQIGHFIRKRFIISA